MTSVPERISEILATMSNKNPSADRQRDLARISGASASVVNQWLNGGIKSIRMDYALNIERELGFNHIWIVSGKGEKFVRQPDLLLQSGDKTTIVETKFAKQDVPSMALVYLTSEEMELVTSFREASTAGRTAILHTARAFRGSIAQQSNGH